MAESIKNFLAEIKEQVNDILTETGNTTQAFTRYVLDAMCEKGNLGEAEECYAVIRHSTTGNILGEINGFAISLSGETISLFHTIYEPNDEIYSVSADLYQTGIKRLQGYYLEAVAGRCNAMEPSAEDYKICKYIYENADDITSVRLFVISNGSINANLKTPKERIEDKSVQYITWDANKLYQNLCSSSDHISVDIDLMDDLDYNFRVPFIKHESLDEKYNTYIAMLPGEFLYNLYENYNTDLLQFNVRFFKGKKGCNKEIFETLKTKPHRFLAYNNGLTATASEILVEYNDDLRTGVFKFIENFQILNGGQTTASIYYAKKENPNIELSAVYVQMKLIVLQDNIDEFHSMITRYSNTQTKVSVSDYSTNNVFNQKLQEISRTTVSPDLTHSGDITYWYYERVSGQYNQDINRIHSLVDKNKFKLKFPLDKKFDKCELGKIYTAWKQKPYISINGPQKCYKEFIEEYKDFVPDAVFYEDFIAMLIIYRFMEKKNPVFMEYHQVKAQMTIYTLAMLYYVTNGAISLYKIWQNQGLSDNLKTFINDLSRQLYAYLDAEKPSTSTFRDYCKSSKTWEATKHCPLTLNLESIADDLKQSGEDYARRKAAREISERERKLVEQCGAAFWDGLSQYTLDIFSESERKIMTDIAKTLTSSKMLTVVQIFEANQILQKVEEAGLDKDEISNLSGIKTRQRKDKDSSSLIKRIQSLSDTDWGQIRLIVGRVCNEEDSKIVKGVAAKRDKNKLTFKQLVVVCRVLDMINEKYKDKMQKLF